MVTAARFTSAEAATLCHSSVLESPTCPGRNGESVEGGPQLGFASYFVAGKGEYVLAVEDGTVATRLGLQPGDLVLAVNGRPLDRPTVWGEAMSDLRANGGRISLLVRRRRTGRTAECSCRVFCW